MQILVLASLVLRLRVPMSTRDVAQQGLLHPSMNLCGWPHYNQHQDSSAVSCLPVQHGAAEQRPVMSRVGSGQLSDIHQLTNRPQEGSWQCGCAEPEATPSAAALLADRFAPAGTAAPPQQQPGRCPLGADSSESGQAHVPWGLHNLDAAL